MKRALGLVAGLAVAVPCYVFAFGAIAVDDAVGDKAGDIGYGVSVGEASEDAAKKGALKFCKECGDKSCRVAVAECE